MRWRIKYLALADRSIGETVVEADSVESAEAEVNATDRVALDVRPVAWSNRFGRSRPSIALFAEELKALLDAGLNLVEALSTLRAGIDDRASVAFVARLHEQVLQGKRFSQALEAETDVPRVLVAVVKGSEFTSGVAHALGRYLEYHRGLDELKNRLISASIYPGIVLGLGLVIVLFLLGYVVPQFSQIYAQHASTMSMGSALILRLGRFVAAHPWAVVASVVAMITALMVVLWRWRLRGTKADRLRSIPVAGRVLGDLEHARVFETLSMLVGGGFPVPTALGIGTQVALTEHTAEALKAVRHDVEGGATLNASLRRHGIGDEVAARLTAAGENSGNLAGALGHAGEHFARRFVRHIERLSRIIEPVLLIIVGATIGIIVLLMYMPIFDLAGSIR
jgi:general secretion pathway protein F